MPPGLAGGAVPATRAVCRPACRACGRAVQPSPSRREDPLDKLDQLVEAAPEPENTVLTDDARLVRWTGASCSCCSR